MSFSEEEIQEFKTEALELLDVAEKSLLALDTGVEFKVAYDSIFRSFHNLKGAAGMMEMSRLQAHTHELESVFMPLKDNTDLPKSYISYFLSGIDAARTILDGGNVDFDYKGYLSAGAVQTSSLAPSPSIEVAAIPTSSPEREVPVVTGLSEFVVETEEILVRVSKNLRALETGAASRTVIDELYRDIHSIKGTSFLFGFQAMGEISHAMESALEPVRDGTHSASRLLIDGLFKAIEAIELDIECTKQGLPNDQIKSVSESLVRILGAAAKELSLVSTPAVAAPVVTTVSAAATLVPTAGKETAAPVVPGVAPTAAKDADLATTIRVPVSLLDSLMTLMGEMVLVRNEVLQYSTVADDLAFTNLSQRLNVVTSEIQGEMMKTRMQPIGNVMTKFHRVVRDLGQELKKTISFHLEGAETELDKSLLEAIKDPLTHIIRNSCDHGIETPDVRRAAGKSESGKIVVRSFHEGGQVVIEITDDGKGLQKESLLAKAIERGMMTTAEAAQASEKEIFGLIFAPGFSTAQKVTNVSGRGVGMDVVRTNIEKIGGTVDLTSRFGVGTTIRLKIPLTLAIVPALVVQSGGGCFAIPQVKLVELVRVDQNSKEDRIERMQGVPVYRLRGDLLPLIDLNGTLGREANALESGIINIAVLNADSYFFGLIVDEIQDTADIVVKPLSRLLKSLHVYSGATILGDGSVALILDVLGLAKVAQLRNDSNDLQSATAKKAAGQNQNVLSEEQDFLLVKVGSPTKHAIVLGYVNRLEEFTTSQIDVSGANRVVRYRDAILPLVSVNAMLGLTPSKDVSSLAPDDIHSVVVVERAGQLYGIEVESILDTLSTTAPLDRSLGNQAGIVGNISTPQELIVVIDPFELISKAFGAQGTHAKVFAANGAKRQAAVIPAGAVSGPESLRELLLVEDTAFFRRVVKEVLEKEGFRVTVAGDGVEAIEVLNRNQNKFSLIISDIEMPRMNGFEFAKAVRATAIWAHVPMLALSSRFDQKYTDQAAAAGFDHYLEKMRPEVLLDAVSGLIKQRGAA